MNAAVDSQTLVTDEQINQVIQSYSGRQGALLGVLEEVQELNPFKYLPEESLRTISRLMKVPLSQLYSVVTFYSFFNLTPQGKHSIIVCRGTACHTKGSKALLNDIGPMLGLKSEFPEGESAYTTPDNEFTIKTVACFGQCALSPVVSVDGVIHSRVNERMLSEIIKKVKTGI